MKDSHLKNGSLFHHREHFLSSAKEIKYSENHNLNLFIINGKKWAGGEHA